MYWDEMSIRNKIKLIWSMRIAVPKPSFKEKVKQNISIKEWKFRYRNAKAVAFIETEHEEQESNGNRI